MCGINGIFSKKNGSTIDIEQLKKMSDSMIHRGPDDSGVYRNTDKTIGFSFRRLSIIDLKNGHQPMSNADKNIWIVFNGEIYNHLDLRKELLNNGYKFRTKSDTEVILHGYSMWGKNVVNHLRGMFAFAIWNEKEKDLFLARDRLGIKPLYYYNDNQFVFSSEIKGINALSNVEQKLNNEAMYHYLTFSSTPAPLTMFKKIKKLEPGHTLLVKQNGEIIKQKYWEPIFNNNSVLELSENDIIKELNILIRKSIELRMMSDVPYGAFLSGGIDSSLNVALMSEISKKSINTFSVSIKSDDISNENENARKIANHYNTNHHEVEITKQNFIEFLPEMVKYQDEPLADPVSIPLYFVSKLARDNGVSVIQVGEGADEIFSGYSLYGMLEKFNRRYYQPFSKLSLPLKKIALSFGELFLSKQKIKYLEWATNDIELFWGGVNVFSEKEKLEILKNGFCYNSYDEIIDPQYKYFNQKTTNADFIDKMIYIDLNHRLPELLLMRVDKMAMAASVETRVPYLDHHLVEFALKIPSSLKIKNGIEKYILKKSAKDIIPDYVINRKKNGFCGSASNMMSNEIVSFARDKILKSDWMTENFDMNEVSTILDHHQLNYKDNGMKIFNLLNLALWEEEWIN